MNRSSTRRAVAGALAASVAVAHPAAAAPSFSIGATAEYTSGDYGGDQSIDEFYLPVSAVADFDKFALRITVPFLSVRAPELTVVDGPDGAPVVGEGPVVTSSGLGDVLATLTMYDVVVMQDGDLAVDVTGKVKFGTASEEDGLGTGEQDYTLQFDAYRYFERFTAMGTAGYSVRGDPEAYDLRNTFFAALGASYRLRDRTGVTVFYDFRQASTADLDASHELSCTVATVVGKSTRVGMYLLAGVGDGAPDWGAGLSLRAQF